MEPILFLIMTIIFACILGKIASDYTFGKREKSEMYDKDRGDIGNTLNEILEELRKGNNQTPVYHSDSYGGCGNIPLNEILEDLRKEEKPKKSQFAAKYPISQLIYDVKYGLSPVKVVLIAVDRKGEIHRYRYPIRLAKYKRFYQDEPYIPCLIIEYIGRDDQVFCFYIKVDRIPKYEDEDTTDEPKIIDARDCWYDLKERCFYIDSTAVKGNIDNRYNADYCFEESTEERKQAPTIYTDDDIVLSRYKKRPIVLECDTSRTMAFICKKDMVLTNPNGDVHANAGDYVVIDRNGYFNPMTKEIFDELYVRADD